MASDVNHGELPHFPWLFADGYFQATKIGLNPIQTGNFNPNAGVAAVPIRSVAPMPEAPISCESKRKSQRANQRKSSTQGLHKAARNISKQQQPKRKSSSKKKKRQINLGDNIERKDQNIIYDEANFDFSQVPAPVCTCTGAPRVCYRWGTGGWQSSCCTRAISAYPLPMSPSRPGARIAGRKMSNGAYRKLLCRLAADGDHLLQAVDLKEHWARHGTNKFVTIK